ncbi:site-specific recombinase XerD [Azospirillum baldaniorum]|uniref:tyrosine-type recombinase/integrase n=1 Tax=Azospirillum baldaniorum TaxID=1064539 RepID=UPI0011A14721|nr:tyrosine-type recombinase/integrase [Azospirillum baldaniorum]TWA71853.1 site-specific recombinase XerD [Azospirillum baldaniorum]
MPTDYTSKPGYFQGYWLEQKPGRDSGVWYRTWYDRGSRQVRRQSTGERDFQAAQGVLVGWVLENERSRNAPRDALTVEAVCLRYWGDHAKKRPSAKTAKREIGIITGWWKGATVADITPDTQRRFREELEKSGTGPGGIDRILSTFRAALNHARKNEEVESVPHIHGFRTADELRSRDPKGRPLSMEELAALLDAAQSRHTLMYLVLAIGTLARPAAILDLTAGQHDAAHGILNLNPPGRTQNKKWRPVIPVAPALTPWLDGTAHEATGRYVTYRGKPISSILATFRVARVAAGLDERVTPYSIRHTMAREMRKAGVSTEEIGLFLGHIPQGTSATTLVYAPFEPGYLSAAREVVEAVFQRLGRLTKMELVAKPAVVVGGGHLMSVPTGRAFRHGIGEAKRAEVRRLILEGVPHAEVVRRTGVSGGTVSAIRQALKTEQAVLRASR